MINAYLRAFIYFELNDEAKFLSMAEFNYNNTKKNFEFCLSFLDKQSQCK